MMNVIEITSFGLPQVLRPGQRPLPEPGAGELRIRVSASGINRPDVLQRTGNYPGARRRIGYSGARSRRRDRAG